MSDGSYPMGANPSGGSSADTTTGSPVNASGGASSGDSSMVDTAKEEASQLKTTATDAAKNVAGTAKDEAASVAETTKSQAVDLFHQTQREVSDQAAAQQRRLAAGLSSIGDELGSMARNADGGIAADLVQRVSSRASSAASWLEARDPASVLSEVKQFARRRPAAFIGAALVAGVAAGRLTRALISDAKDESSGSSSSASTSVPAARPVVATEPAVAPGDSPVYAASAARLQTPPQGVTYDRSDDSL